jgi:hypothetical protein
MRIVIMLGFVVAVGAANVQSATAQTCGDANDDDAVSVTDGVQALRAAASLSSSCGEGCDVDGSGSISVTDGVNILRKAAGLSFTAACEFTGEEANEVVTPSTGIFDAIGKIPGIGGAEAAGTAECDNDGTVNVDQNGAQAFAAFVNCEIGGIILDGALSRATFGQGEVLAFDALTITRIKTGRALTFSGQLTIAISQEGRRLSGTLDVDSEARGSFIVRFTRVLIIGGSPRDGGLLIDLGDADGGTIDSILITFATGNELEVRVQLRNGQVKQFILDRRTRLVRPLL